MPAQTPEEIFIREIVQAETRHLRLQNRVEWLEKDVKVIREALVELLEEMSK